jgi:hypothetical protein
MRVTDAKSVSWDWWAYVCPPDGLTIDEAIAELQSIKRRRGDGGLPLVMADNRPVYQLIDQRDGSVVVSDVHPKDPEYN